MKKASFIFNFLCSALLLCASCAHADQISLKCGAHTIEAADASEGEYVGVRVKILDSNHKPVVPEISAGGEMVSLCKQHEFLVLDTNLLYTQAASFLYSEDGKVVMRENLGEIYEYGKSDDDKLFWVQAEDVDSDGKPVVILKVYDYQGKQLIQKSFGNAMNYSLKYQGRLYGIQVIDPNFPG